MDSNIIIIIIIITQRILITKQNFLSRFSIAQPYVEGDSDRAIPFRLSVRLSRAGIVLKTTEVIIAQSTMQIAEFSDW